MDSYNYLECSLCKGWDLFENFHTGKKFSLKRAEKLVLTCNSCKINTTLEVLQMEVSQLKSQVTTLENNLSTEKHTWADHVKNWKDDNAATRQELLGYVDKKAETVTITTSDSKLTSHQLRQTTDEAMDVERRRLNIIVSGLLDRNNDIEDLVRYINSNYHLNTSLSTSDFGATKRLGRLGQGKPRLLCVTTKHNETRQLLLSLFKYFKNQQKPNIFFRPDLTKAQQEEDRKLRLELTRLGKDRFKIHKGQVVLRYPSDTPDAANILPNSEGIRPTSKTQAPKNNPARSNSQPSTDLYRQINNTQSGCHTIPKHKSPELSSNEKNNTNIKTKPSSCASHAITASEDSSNKHSGCNNISMAGATLTRQPQTPMGIGTADNTHSQPLHTAQAGSDELPTIIETAINNSSNTADIDTTANETKERVSTPIDSLPLDNSPSATDTPTSVNTANDTIPIVVNESSTTANVAKRTASKDQPTAPPHKALSNVNNSLTTDISVATDIIQLPETKADIMRISLAIIEEILLGITDSIPEKNNSAIPTIKKKSTTKKVNMFSPTLTIKKSTPITSRVNTFSPKTTVKKSTPPNVLPTTTGIKGRGPIKGREQAAKQQNTPKEPKQEGTTKIITPNSLLSAKQSINSPLASQTNTNASRKSTRNKAKIGEL